MRIALAQINSFLGDFEGNKKKILEYTARAQARRCDLVVFPEAALFGYHPVDLLERHSVVAEQERVLRELHKALPKGIAVIVGAIVRNPKKGKGYWNAAVFLEKGVKPKVFAKQLLPTYDVFDESRHIQPGETAKNIFKFKGKRVLVTICEDIWAWDQKGSAWFSKYGENPLKKIRRGSVDLVVNLSASPFTHSKLSLRQNVVKCTVKHFGVPMVYVNMVGAQDELIFDGGSFALNKKGQITAQCVRFEEDLNVLDLKDGAGGLRELSTEPQEILRTAVVLGVRDFLRKTGFRKVHFGLSGGMDSALVACIAADALGPQNVTGISLPGPFTSKESRDYAEKLAANLGINYLELKMDGAYKDIVANIDKTLGPAPFGLTNENLQARLRGVLLMAYSNRENSLLMGTSNKSELAVGYATLYGDLCGALEPIGDLLKTEVYKLARHYNSQEELIPDGIITRAPSAELRENQTDQDSLPPYEVLDEIIRRLVEGFHKPKSDLDHKILGMMMKSEFKRWQAPPILKVSDHAFGRGRRFPVAHIGRY